MNIYVRICMNNVKYTSIIKESLGFGLRNRLIALEQIQELNFFSSSIRTDPYIMLILEAMA